MKMENMIREQEEKKILISLDELAAAMRACDEAETMEAAEKVDRLSDMIEDALTCHLGEGVTLAVNNVNLYDIHSVLVDTVNFRRDDCSVGIDFQDYNGRCIAELVVNAERDDLGARICLNGKLACLYTLDKHGRKF